MQKLKSEGKINYRKVDVDQDTNLTTKYSIRNIPTLVLLENGEVKGRLSGLNTEQAIQNFYNG
jgi:thioredoxin 1